MSRSDSPTRPLPRLAAVAATTVTAAFAVGSLVAQLVLVPSWQAADPGEFLDRFATEGVTLGAVQFPLLVASLLLVAAVAVAAFRRRARGRLLWGSALLAVLGVAVLLPVYFAGANSALLDPAFPLDGVAEELTAWSAWNWLRTGLSLAATMLCASALVVLPDRHHDPSADQERS
ncbi:DUF1772 domain-containing protein [Myceligenerans salitolerans]|uniref:DUF1772 domain-containing protein n=1 Tax=Myceligenerans salitolerans TaxID=1230528 RepID=A0ABS3ICN2_9MICO|nr:DUF1772 domain-containing protein [Myceligenerans salitolerans]MBO0610366.1 DUF1772 domain-containing protein [Myceligenerans salitolerans]